MPKTLTQDEKLHQMTETPIPRLLVTLAAPSIVSMLITSLYNMADTYFVGLIGSASATGAVGVAFPLMAILQAVGFMFGHGSGNHMSRSLGAGDADNARRMASTGFFSALFAGIVLMVLGLFLLEPLVFVLGSTPTIAPYAEEYLFYIMLGAPWLVSSLVLNNQFRFQGNAFYGMIGMTAGAIINVGLDPLFIFVFDMGVAGAALATAISQFISFVVLLAGTRRGGNMPVSLRSFKPGRAIYLEIFRGGVPSLFRQGLASVATICLNFSAGLYGDAAIAAMSIVTRIMQFAGSAIIGFGQGFQPICGFNYGAKRYDRVRKAFWFSVKIAFGCLLVVSLIGLFFAPQVVDLFITDNPEVTEIGALSLQLQCLFLPLFSFVIISNMMLQTIGMAGKASLLAASRQGLFFIPTVLLLPRFLGLLGVQLSQAVADVCSFIFALPLTFSVLKQFKQQTPAEDNKIR